MAHHIQSFHEVQPQPHSLQHISLIRIVVFVIIAASFAALIGTVSYLAGISSTMNKQAENESIIDSTPLTNQPTPTIAIDTSAWKTYKFKKTALEFSYPAFMMLKQQYENSVMLTDNGSSLSIKAGDHVFGIESPNAQVSSAPVIINGKPLELFKKQVYKTRVDYKGENYTNFIIDLRSNTNEKIAIISYNFKNGIVDEKENQLFDQILSTFKFTQ